MNREQDVIFTRGKRLYLRPLMKKDVPNLLRWINDHEVNQFLATFIPVSEIYEDRWFEGLEDRRDTNIVFAIVANDGKFIGDMGLNNIRWKDRTACTGAMIGDKDYWGQGYGTEAKMLLLNYAFNTLNLRKITSSVLAFNKRSLSYLKKCGYKETGIQREHYFVNGEYVDEIMLEVFRKNWTSLWESCKEQYLS